MIPFVEVILISDEEQIRYFLTRIVLFYKSRGRVAALKQLCNPTVKVCLSWTEANGIKRVEDPSDVAL